MDSIREQMDLTNEISEAISNPVGMGQMVDEVSDDTTCSFGMKSIFEESANSQDELKAELEALEQEELDDRLRGADRVPVHTPASPIGQTNGPSRMSPILFPVPSQFARS
jgi:charged multivesicular body protein 4A/B